MNKVKTKGKQVKNGIAQKKKKEWNHSVDLLHISRALEAQQRMGVRPWASCAIRALS